MMNPTPAHGKMLFVLCSERSGSTLLTRMLARHPGILAPSELWFLCYQDFDAWQREKPQAIHSLMEIAPPLGLPGEPDELAVRFGGMDTISIYQELLRRLPQAAVLVDKTPAYANELSTLAKSLPLDATYLWLLRHPLGVIDSDMRLAEKQGISRFRRVKQTLQRAMNAGMTHRERRREEKWLLQNRNIGTFLKSVPGVRQSTVIFEDLLLHPEESLRGICNSLEIEYHAAMLDPFASKAEIKPGLGNPNFHTRSRIETTPVHSWKERYSPIQLRKTTLEFMETFGASSWNC